MNAVERTRPRRRDGFGWCYRCGESWKRVEPHRTAYSDSGGCFPLCEQCWSDLDPEARLPYYRMLWGNWLSNGTHHNGVPMDEVWEQFEAAVRAGL